MHQTKYNNKPVDWEKVNHVPLCNAENAENVLGSNGKQKILRLKNEIIKFLTNTNDPELMSIALFKAMLDPKMQRTTKFVVDKISSSNNWKCQASEAITVECTSLHKEKQALSENLAANLVANFKDVVVSLKEKGGRWTNLAEQFVRTVFIAFAGNNVLDNVSDQVIEFAFGLTSRTVKKRFALAAIHRAHIEQDDNKAFKIVVKGKRRLQITTVMRKAIKTFIDHHEHVRVSPCMNDTLKIDGQTVFKKVREVSVAHLHRDLAESDIVGILDENNNVTVSESSLRALLQSDMKYLKKATTKHLEMCGCVTCIVMNNVQQSLNNFRKKKLRQLEINTALASQRLQKAFDGGIRMEIAIVQRQHEVSVNALKNYGDFAFPDGLVRHPKPSDALSEMMCSKIDCGGVGIFKWKCVINKCKSCPSPKFHPIETNPYCDSDDTVHFEHYVKYSRCAKHGLLGKGDIKECTLCASSPQKAKISRKKERTKDKLIVSRFMAEIYVPSMEKYRFHYPHMKILSTNQCVAARTKAFKNNPDFVMTSRDYAEAFNVVFNGEMQTDHFGRVPKIFLESSTFSFHTQNTQASKASCRDVVPDGEEEPRITDNSELVEEHYCAHFSDDAKQHATTSRQNMMEELELMKGLGVLKTDKTVILDHTDGCCAQYRSATAVYLMSVLSMLYRVTIDRMIHAPSHGKGKVDGLAAVIKKFLLECMRNAKRCSSDDCRPTNRFKPWSHTDGKENSFATQAESLCNAKYNTPDEKNIGFGEKRKKRDQNKAVSVFHFKHVTQDEIKLQAAKMNTLKLNNGQKHGGSQAMYNVRTDPSLGYNKAALRRIPCACTACVSQLKLPWEEGKCAQKQQRYAQNTDCVLWPAFLGENDWIIVTTTHDSTTPIEDMENMAETILLDQADLTLDEVTPGTFGAVSITGKKNSNEFEVVEFLEDPFIFDKETYVGDLAEVEEAKDGDWLVKAKIWHPVPRQSQWHYPTETTHHELVRKIVATNLQLKVVSVVNPMPRSGSYRAKDQLAIRHAHKMEKCDECKIMTSIANRDTLDFIMENEYCDERVRLEDEKEDKEEPEFGWDDGEIE